MGKVKGTFLPIFWFLISCVISDTLANGDHPWCYNEEKCAPSNWGGPCKSGHAQSPIDFNKTTISPTKHLRKIRINKAYLEEYSEFYVKNNGHTVQIQLREDLTSSLRIDSDGFRNTRYQLSQLHFHWGSRDDIGSEHTVDGRSYPMELHLVHFSDKYSNLLEAITDQNPRALAVFGVFFEISSTDNPALTAIVDSVATVETYLPDPTLFKTTTPLNLSLLFPDVMDVFRYEGSLTTPSCGQKVVWTVFKNPIPISETQMEVFRKLKDTFGHALVDNFRPVQPIRRRKVYENIVHLHELPESQDEDLNQAVRSLENSSPENDSSETTKSSAHGHHDADTAHRNETNPKSSTTKIKSHIGLPAIILTTAYLHLM